VSRNQQQEGNDVREDARLCTRGRPRKAKTPGAGPARDKAGRRRADQNLESARNAEEVPQPRVWKPREYVAAHLREDAEGEETAGETVRHGGERSVTGRLLDGTTLEGS